MEELNTKIADAILQHTQKLTELATTTNNTNIPNLIRNIDKMSHELYYNLYNFVDTKKNLQINNEKCGHCG